MNGKDTAIKKMNFLGCRGKPFFFIIDFKMNEPVVLTPEEINHKKILFFINGFKNYKISGKNILQNLTFSKQPVSYPDYLEAFDKVMHNIKVGNTYLLNLTFPTTLKTNLDLEQIFHFSSAKYKLWYKDHFIVFSPETFIKIIMGKIYSFPMKGTIDAEIKNAQEAILNDPKELAEHYTIVDLIRNDLNIVAKEVKVERFRYIEKIKTNQKNLLQVSSQITGLLESDYCKNIGYIIFSLLPAGSVTGAPKKKTVEIIQEIETYKRGFYTGIFGYFDGENLDSAVMIRFIEKENGQMIYKSGGGITSFSDPVSEYRELIDKVYVPVA